MYYRPIRAVWRCIWAAFIAAAFIFVQSTPALAEDAVNRANGQVYTIVNTVQLENRSGRPIENIRLEVPLAAAESVVWQDFLQEELSPQPQSVFTNAAGLRVAVYEIDRLDAGEVVQMVQRVAVRNYCVSFDIAAQTDAPLPEELAPYLQPSVNINSDEAEIKEFARLSAAASSNPYLQARLLFAAVNNHMTYDNNAGGTHSALAAYRNRRGNCDDYADLYAACLRSLGIPARVCSGYIYGRAAQTDSSYLSPAGHIDADKIRHSWVTFYISGVGWLVADPTFSYLAAGGGDSLVDWDRFAAITPDNRLVYTGSQLPDNSSIEYTYQGAAPLVSYHSELALYSLLLPFSDLVDHWAADSVLGLYYNAPPLVSGMAPGYFGVDEQLTRAEFATILNRVLDSADPQNIPAVPSLAFSDLTPAHWAYDEMRKAVARGILDGYPDGTIRPNAKLTRAEAAAMLNRIVGGTPTAAAAFSDVGAGSYGWAAEAIANLAEKQIMTGVSAERFAPARLMTRGEGAAIIYRWILSDDYRGKYLDY